MKFSVEGRFRLAAQSALIAGLSFGGVGAAYAQDEQPAAETGNVSNLGTMQVTGSRIRKADLETQQPVFSVSREDIQKQGLTSVADVLQRLSTAGAALNTQFNNGGDGSSNISLRNLGASRTLVLVNGRRWTTSLTGAVDLNTLPVAMIERIDVLKDGASTIYGSDAIAGVVNIITRQNFQGTEFHTYQGEFGQGDGRRQMYDFTFGSTNDKGSLLFGLSHVNEEPVMGGDRKISSNRNSPYNPGYSGTGVPGSFLDGGTRYVIDNGQIRPYAGRDGANANDGYFTADDNYLLTPQERSTLYAQGSYALAPWVTFRSDAMVNKRISEQLLAAMPVTQMTLDADNLYNPFYGTAGARDVTGVNRRFTETGGRSFNQDVTSLHMYTGFDGSFQFADRNFSWDAGFAYNKTNELTTTYGLMNVVRLQEAYGPTQMVNGSPVCADTDGNVISGCVPINPLGPNGSISQAALDYVTFNAHDTAQVEQYDYTLNFSGDIVQLPGGMLSFAAGFERREESGSFEPDAFIAAGYSTGNAASPTSGGYSLNEYFIELSIPVLSDVFLAKSLELSTAVRYSDYSNFGDTTNAKVGIAWRPVDELLVRGNYSEGFRAPSINDLYMGAADSYENYADPCASNFPGGPQPNCTGIPATNTLPGEDDQTDYPFQWTSNADLKPETSKTKTVGFVVSPKAVPGLDITLDWWNIKIKDAITRLDAQYILDQCYTESAQSFCGYVQRDPNDAETPYIITALEMPMFNLAGYEVEGYDLTLNYKTKMTPYGRFGATWDTTYTSKWQSQGSPESPKDDDLGKYYGTDPYWRVRSNLMLDWAISNFGATWNARYYSALNETCIFSGANAEAYCSDPEKGTNKLATRLYHDVQGRWSAPWNGDISVGIQNLFDKDPPLALNAPYNNFDPQYPTPGRFYYMSYLQRF